jgi:hypothetical protein
MRLVYSSTDASPDFCERYEVVMNLIIYRIRAVKPER